MASLGSGFQMGFWSMLRAIVVAIAVGLLPFSTSVGSAPNLAEPPHDYFRRVPRDRFTQIKGRLESGELQLDRSSELGFLVSLLKELKIPVSSQSLVFSTTSLQLSLISPSNPRAIYFNDEIAIGFIPGGKIEVIGNDPELGAVFYIFPRPVEGQGIQVERSQRCMNCHAGEETDHVPGWVLKSVVPGPGGGSLVAYRLNETGHSIPLSDRFGGWYLTHQGSVTQHWGNVVGRFSEGSLLKSSVTPGTTFSWSKYPVSSSGLLPQLLMEHQAGFVNRAAAATYRTRELFQPSSTNSPAAQDAELRMLARGLVRYLLFSEEAALPAGGVPEHPEFQNEFRADRREVDGISLKDFDLRTRLFKRRCSYMIYSPTCTGLLDPLKRAVMAEMVLALGPGSVPKEFRFLPDSERAELRRILRATVPEFAGAWGAR